MLIIGGLIVGSVPTCMEPDLEGLLDLFINRGYYRLLPPEPSIVVYISSPSVFAVGKEFMVPPLI
jgi:hypothetical protein